MLPLTSIPLGITSLCSPTTGATQASLVGAGNPFQGKRGRISGLEQGVQRVEVAPLKTHLLLEPKKWETVVAVAGKIEVRLLGGAGDRLTSLDGALLCPVRGPGPPRTQPLITGVASVGRSPRETRPHRLSLGDATEEAGATPSFYPGSSELTFSCQK